MSDSALPEFIAKPSADKLRFFCDYFKSTHRAGLAIDDTIDRLDGQSLRNAVNSLLEVLQYSVAGEVRDQLRTLDSWINSNVNALSRMKTLLKAALVDEPNDALIQLLVGRAIEFVKSIPPRPTTPCRPISTLDFSPIRTSSRSQQGTEQSRSVVEHRLFEEIRGHTYRAVPGFWEKYFEGRPWSDHASTIYEQIKEEHVGGQWSDLTGSPNQEKVLDWLFRFQNASPLLSKQKYGYSTIKHGSDVTGGEAKRQIDMITKPKSLTDHSWKDIAVIGALNNNGVKATLLQLACYARDVFAQQPTRRFLHAFMIAGPMMETWLFDRSGVYSGGSFDIHKEAERFIRVLAGYLLMDEFELGLDTFMKPQGDYYLIDIPWVTGERKRLELKEKPLTYQRAIVSRATSCFLARIHGSEDDDFDYVVKFSWPPIQRKPEDYFLRSAKEKGVVGLVDLLGHYEITTISSMRDGLQFLKPYTFRRPADRMMDNSKKRSPVDSGPQPHKRHRSSKEQSGNRNAFSLSMEDSQWPAVPLSSDAYNLRAFRCLVIYPAGQPIYKYTSPVELLEALRDAIKAHESLHEANILHRDISENNIIITDKNKTGFSGRLIDLDLAKELGSERSGGALCRAGTMEFMAIQVLLEIDHTYRHDLESFFYVLLWQCIVHGRRFADSREEPAKKTMVPTWYTGDLAHIANAKRGLMVKDGFDDVLKEFPRKLENVKPLCRDLRSILFHDDGQFYGTPGEPPRVLYGQIISAFDDAIVAVRNTSEGI